MAAPQDHGQSPEALLLSQAPAPTTDSKKQDGLWKRILPAIITVVIFYFIFQRIPFDRFLAALAGADYPRFFLLMIPNSVFYFCWDTLVLAFLMRWFHGPMRYRDLLPVRAVTYVVSLMNTHLARGAMAFYLTRQLRAPFFELASTVMFLWLVELTHLGLWATAGMVSFPWLMPEGVFWVPVGFVIFWVAFLSYVRLGFAPWRPLLAPFGRLFPRWRGRGQVREWAILRTFREAATKRYVQFILLRAPMFAVALVLHYFAVRTFGMEIPLGRLVAFLPIIFMLASLPITVAHLGTTQAAWIFFFNDYAAESQLLAYSLASHLAYMLGRALLGLVFLPRAYEDLVGSYRRRIPYAQALEPAQSPDS
ncbi:MAG TPA: lysylphosphatidylglycerol synthase transmembrane domain-containing protein [Candidatus Acidoferrales bacterium]|nr:lysylphosphatidylglycerol synthase transmembrane domain-containing protein [Candidatus Acidoferrales bacterium]